jgi:hypothetical protein
MIAGGFKDFNKLKTNIPYLRYSPLFEELYTLNKV